MRVIGPTLALLVSLTGCEKKPATENAANAMSGQLAAGYVRVVVGEVSSVKGAADEDDPQVVIDAIGRAVVAYKTGGQHHVVRWEGGAWKTVGGGPVACRGEMDRYSIAVDDKNAVLVGGTIKGGQSTQPALGCVVVESGGAWKQLGASFGDEQATSGGISVLWATGAPTAILHQEKNAVSDLQLWRFDGTAWKPAGDGDGKAPVSTNYRVSRFAAVALPEGLAVLWIQHNPRMEYGSPWSAKLVASTMQWQLLSPLTDWDRTSSFELGATASGTMLLSRTFKGAFKEVRDLSKEEGIWVTRGDPGAHDYLAHDLPAIAGGATKDAVLAWAGEKIQVALHDGTTWTNVVRDLGRRPGVQTATRVAMARDGTIAVTWRDRDPASKDPARIYAAIFARAR